MTQQIIFPTPKGMFKVALIVIAKNRADYYIEDKNSRDYKGNVKFILEDDFEGIDWLLNNMDFEDIESKSVKISDDIKVTDEDFWTSSDNFEIVPF